MSGYDLSRYYHGERPEMMPFVPKDAKRILEIGCGEGHFSELLARELNCETWGLELDPGAAAAARKRLNHVFQGDIYEQLSLIPKKNFNCVILNDVLEHLADTERALNACADALAPQGSLVLSVPNVRHFSTMYRYLFRGDWTYEDAGVLDRTHLRFFTVKSLTKTLQALGFNIAEIRPINEDRSFKVKLIRWLSFGFLADVGYLQIAAVCTRRDR